MDSTNHAVPGMLRPVRNDENGSDPEPRESKPITISEDQSKGSAIEQRRLIALCPGDKASPASRDERPAPSNSHELQDYQMQKMLLEQQNKRRLMIARQKQAEESQESPVASRKQSAGRSPAPVQRSQANRMKLFSGPEDVGIDDDDLSTLEVQALREQITFLEAKLKKHESIQSNSVPSRHQVLYRLREYNNSTEDDGDDSRADGGARPVFTTFMDSPEVVHGPKKDARLRCSVPLDNFELHLAVNPDISFIVFRDYDKTIDLPPPKDRDIHNYGKVHLPGHASESIYPVASDLKEVLGVILNRRPEYRRILGEYEGSGELAAPYLFIYHNRHEMEDIKGELSAAAQDQLGLLLDYVTHVLGDEYYVADSLLGRKEILPEYVKYLFKPDDILVERVGDEYTGYIAKNWPSQSDEKPNRRARRPRGLNLHDLNLRDPIAQQSPRNPYVWKVKGMTCKFDGRFYRIRKELEFEVSPDGCPQQDTAALEPGRLAETQRRGKAITDLRVFPLRYAPDGIVDMLRKRGDTFWRCRTRRLVSYHANEQEEFSNIVCPPWFPSLPFANVRLTVYLDRRPIYD